MTAKDKKIETEQPKERQETRDKLTIGKAKINKAGEIAVRQIKNMASAKKHLIVSQDQKIADKFNESIEILCEMLENVKITEAEMSATPEIVSDDTFSMI